MKGNIEMLIVAILAAWTGGKAAIVLL